MVSSMIDVANSFPAAKSVPAWCNPSHGVMNAWLNFRKIRKWCKRMGYSEFGRYKALSGDFGDTGGKTKLIGNVDN